MNTEITDQEITDQALLHAETPARAWTEDLHEAARAATHFIRAHYHDSNAWVRLILFAGADAESGGQTMVYHFEATGPQIVGEPQVSVRCDQAGVWRAVLNTWELPAPAVTARWGQTHVTRQVSVFNTAE